ncbi:MAG TPA: ribokinase [Candidatus Dormibacteraeota bacterium]
MAPLVVLGSLNVDLVARVPALPAPGETALGRRLETFTGGKGANQAIAAARLGGRVAMVGRVGRDAGGDALLAQLARDGVDAAGVARDDREPTGTALIMVDDAGENLIAVTAGANGGVGAPDVDRALAEAGADGLLVLQLEVPPEAVARAVALASRGGVRVVLNAAPAAALDPALLRGLEALVVNESEAAALLGRALPGPEAARELQAAGARLAVVTLGAAGAALCDASGPQSVEPFAVTAVDTTAAGDAFVGARAVGLAAGRPAPEAARLASAAGAAAATRAGAQASLPTAADLVRLFGVTAPEP